MPERLILQVAIASPLRQLFDYLPPADGAAQPAPGMRVRVPFGRRDAIGLVAAVKTVDDPEQCAGLKRAEALLDTAPVLAPELLQLVSWAADYYQHSLGEALSQALPVLLRKGRPAAAMQKGWRLTTQGLGLPEGALGRSPKQAAALAALQQRSMITAEELPSLGLKTEHLRALAGKALVEVCAVDFAAVPPSRSAPVTTPSAQTSTGRPQLNADQQHAIDAVAANFGNFRCHLLEGVTGSGKTEVYLHLIEQTIAAGQQALVLVPEIGLTPQTLARFRERVAGPIALMHSGLNEGERLQAWREARSGHATLIVGTRSAIFSPAPRLGLIIIDEEHDPSYKQQDGFRYHARDVAIKRAASAGVPVLLGSATPSLESLRNALESRYRHLPLTERAGGARLPTLQLKDIRHAVMRDGLGPDALAAIGATLATGRQVLVFLNRRGFAPTLLCHDCGWIAECRHCDARLTVHAAQRRLRCHHCDWQQPLPVRCGGCHGSALEFRGPGTERLERALHDHFPAAPVVRIDRDTTSRKDSLQTMLDQVGSGRPCVLVGTQMLAKGHHFPDVTLVVMVDIDGGLFSADFRGPERIGQIVTQVAGRAGRGAQAGHVLIQTHYPDHPLLTGLVREGYHRYARALLDERRLLELPPYSHVALVRADGRDLEEAERMLSELKPSGTGVFALGPLPAPMSRRAGLFRAQLLLRAGERGPLHAALKRVVAAITSHPLARRIRCSIDVDPVDMS